MPAKPKSAFPNPAAILPGEADVLANVLADLSDHDAKLVYADWLEERDDPRGPLLREFVAAYRTGKKKLPVVDTAPKPWRDLVGITLIEEARKKEVETYTDAFLRLARPALRLELVETVDKKLSVGTSKFHGIPDTPADMEWPQWDSSAYSGLRSFAAQINLADLQRSVVARELPSAGLLSFWWGMKHSPKSHYACRVFHFLDTSELVRRNLPREVYNNGQYNPSSITFTETLTLPDVADSSANYDPNLGDDVYDACTELHPQYFENYIFGYARTIHFDVPERKGERLLLQLAAGNVLNFTISNSDLRKHRFDRVGLSFEK